MSRIGLAVGLTVIAVILATAAVEAAKPTPEQRGCIGSFQSALARTRSTRMVRDEGTGAWVPLHRFDGDLNPGDFGGGPGWLDLLTQTGVVNPERPEYSCALAIPWIEVCLDFSAESDCSPFLVDTDGDRYLDGVEMRAGSDPAGVQSTPENALLDEQTGSNTCRDRVDSDLDGSRDSADAGCRLMCQDFGNRDRCSDEDGDDWLQYVEEEYGSDANDPDSTPFAP